MGPEPATDLSRQGHRSLLVVKLSDQNSGYHSAHSVCESFDMRDLEGDYASQVAEEATPVRKTDTGGVEPTVKSGVAAALLPSDIATAVGKEKEALKMPKELPTVNELHHWLALTASALVEASAYDDRAEVAWLAKVNDP